jgi:hypothetical protein
LSIAAATSASGPYITVGRRHRTARHLARISEPEMMSGNSSAMPSPWYAMGSGSTGRKFKDF